MKTIHSDILETLQRQASQGNRASEVRSVFLQLQRDLMSRLREVEGQQTKLLSAVHENKALASKLGKLCDENRATSDVVHEQAPPMLIRLHILIAIILANCERSPNFMGATSDRR